MRGPALHRPFNRRAEDLSKVVRRALVGLRRLILINDVCRQRGASWCRGDWMPSMGRFTNAMFRRLGVVLIAVLFSLGLFAGFAGAHAALSVASATCHGQTMADQSSASNPAPARDCDVGTTRAGCLAHVSCLVFMSPAPAHVQSRVMTDGWAAAPLLGLEGTRPPPATPPPIALL